MSQVNTRAVDDALAALTAAAAERDQIAAAFEQATSRAATRYADATAAAQQSFDTAIQHATETRAQRHAAAKTVAERLMAEAVPTLEADCDRRGVQAAAGFGTEHPREIAQLRGEANQLQELWSTFDVLSELEAEQLAEPKPLLRWIWLGVLGAGTLGLVVMGLTAG